MQSKKHSLVESLTNTFVGFGISWASTFLIFPLVGIHSNAGKNLIITLYFTIISIARSYILRRYWNKKAVRAHAPPPVTAAPFVCVDFDLGHRSAKCSVPCHFCER